MRARSCSLISVRVIGKRELEIQQGTLGKNPNARRKEWVNRNGRLDNGSGTQVELKLKMKYENWMKQGALYCSDAYTPNSNKNSDMRNSHSCSDCFVRFPST